MKAEVDVVLGLTPNSDHKVTHKKLGKLKAGRHPLEKLTDLTVRKMTKPGSHADGGGLYLHITSSGAKSWVFRFSRKLGADKPKAREMGLGPTHTVGLAEARLEALECRKLLLKGLDPIEHRKAAQAERLQQQRQVAIAAQKVAMTFDLCVVEYLKAKSSEWSNDKHAAQWTNTLQTYAAPVIGSMPVAEIDTPAVVEVFRRDKFWEKKTETATRVRQRIEAVLDWAKVQNYRSGDNPARWDGCLEHVLASPNKIKKVRKMPSLPYAQMPEFLIELRKQTGMAARALEFGILHASRPGEVVGATWSEIDTEERTWTIPAARMKGRKEHRVPLGPRAIEILEEARKAKHDDFVFPSGTKDKSMSDMAISALLKRMNKARVDAQLKPWVDPKQEDAVVVAHGFRSTFSTYIAEKTEFPEDLREACMAHAVKNKVLDAYQRGERFDKRRALLDNWQQHCEGVSK